MRIAIERILRAIQSGEPITLFGDYDTDGVCGTAMVARFFRDIGIQVHSVLPHRVRDGYGLSVAAVKKLMTERNGLLITIDNGTSAADAVKAAQDAGIDVIITDHHHCPDSLPPAIAVVNPHRPDSTYPYPELCGTGVAFKMLMALRKALRDSGFFADQQPNLMPYLTYVAIATVADVMPLTGENRILVKAGLRSLATSPGTGLAVLMRLANIDPATIDSESIAYRISPRLNAAGRMDDAQIAFNCLYEDDVVRAAEAAEQLDCLNTARQAAEQKILRSLDTPDMKLSIDSSSGIAIGSSDYAIGVVGIIAGRLARLHDKPAVVVSFEHGIGKGSARGISGISVLKILEDCAGHLTAFGGHDQAAGVTVTPEQWPQFQNAFSEAASRYMATRTTSQRPVDAIVDATELTSQLGRDLKRLAPFGVGNPEPVLTVRPLTIHSRRLVGANHLKLRMGNNLVTVDAIGFGLWEHPAAQTAMQHVIGVPELNTWQGETRLQLRLLDLDPKLDWL